ncbi:protease FtsH-inhibitory lysogeny factor CIII [Salmonella enterica subsp. enterica]|nr:protease FtsH-inhibitory lysogeny factor CIII [Salmonella enterica subsp. enterica serovar Javiana]
MPFKRTKQTFYFVIAHLNESLLERITRKLRAGWKRLVDILNQPGVPCNG